MNPGSAEIITEMESPSKLLTPQQKRFEDCKVGTYNIFAAKLIDCSVLTSF